MCVKCVKILPPDASVTMDKVKVTLEKEVFEKKLAAEIPKFFNGLKKQADPQIYLKRPPTAREFQDGTNHLIQTGGITPPTNPTPGPAPMKMP